MATSLRPPFVKTSFNPPRSRRSLQSGVSKTAGGTSPTRRSTPLASPLDKQKGVRGSQYVSIKYTERLAEAGIEPSVGSVGDSYDNALAEPINGLYKAEVIHRRGPWRSFEAVAFATLTGVD
jgi:hypothetical protein